MAKASEVCACSLELHFSAGGFCPSPVPREGGTSPLHLSSQVAAIRASIRGASIRAEELTV